MLAGTWCDSAAQKEERQLTQQLEPAKAASKDPNIAHYDSMLMCASDDAPGAVPSGPCPCVCGQL